MRAFLVIPFLLAVIFAACGGGGNGGDAAKTTPQSAATSSAASTPSSDTAVTAAPSETSAPTVDPFAGLQSYHYQMQMSGDGATSITIKGSVKAPDSISMDFYLSDSDAAVNSIVIIGTQAWTKNSVSGQWETVDIAEAEGEISGLLPKDFWGDFPLDTIVGVSSDLGEESVNGVTAHHYQISEADADTMAKLAEIFGAGDSGTQPDKFAMDLWRATDGGWPVKATIGATYPAGSEVTQASVSWEVSDVNSGDVSIQPPA
jgi:hypothetical protein